MKQRQIKRLWHGLASLRDYEVEKYIKEGGVRLILGNQSMTLSPEQLQKGFQATLQKHKSKFGTQAYFLVDYKFIADSPQQPTLF